MDIVNLNAVRSELANCEARANALRLLVRRAEAVQGRFDALTGGLPLPRYQNGLTDAVRAIIEAAPDEIFATVKIRLILKNQGYDTKQRNFGSSLSTVLTRLGRAGFITITTDEHGARTYKRKESM
jgi:hypothetical protein